MKLVDEMRKKYAKRERGASMVFAYPPGGADVEKLCKAIERMDDIVCSAQRELEIAGAGVDAQNRIQGLLFMAQNQ